MRERLPEIDHIGLILWILRVVIIALLLWGMITTLLDNPHTGQEWFDLLVFGIVQGSLYALIAVGYTLVFDMLQLINFAHAEIFMIGAMTSTIFVAAPMGNSGFLARQPYLGLLIMIIVAVSTSVFITVLTERVAYRPLRKAPQWVITIAAIGASLFWRSFTSSLYGSEVRIFPQVPAFSGAVPFFGTELIKSHPVAIISSLIFIGFGILFLRTKPGKTIRAVTENKDVAALMGINLDRTITSTFILGAALAGAAGVLYTLVYGKAHFYMGFMPGIKAFTAAILGGIGSVPGALIGGLFLGILESTGPSLFLTGLGIPVPYQLKDAGGLVLLIFILIFCPQGILRRRLFKS